jgi:hypothetical protein
MQIDLPQLVKQGLHHLGCDAGLIAKLDGHSAITLDFDQLPSLLITWQDEHVWFWSRVADYSAAVLAHHSHPILQELMRADESILGGHPGLCVTEGMLELRALVAPAYLESGEQFGEALSLFFERITSLTQQIRQ